MKIRLAGIELNDTSNGDGICVSVFTQGCPHHCPGCHNPETWDFQGGQEYEMEEIIAEIMQLINKNGIQRNLSILGGEPLCQENEFFTIKLAETAKRNYPRYKDFLLDWLPHWRPRWK